MVVGCGRIRLRLFEVHSLKAKRSIVRSTVARIQTQFQATAAETGLNDSHEWAEIGFAVVGNDAALINSRVDKIFNYVDAMGLAMIADTNMEIIHL
ncbi:MAG: DUF503 domain-containing protein [Desulfotignum sp.]|nr:DUF503 domain-containing protein [Desulfotignum sp.]MCF8087220.1 DUF503 domain-containing protein [Desulfotignum sp.]MCF8138281.1 DUF503 domain-containing protein [Desulfotignum sp.]